MTNGSTIKAIAGSNPSRVAKVELVHRVAQEALGEELAADDDVPAHREDPHHGEHPGGAVDGLARPLGEPGHLGEEQQPEGQERAQDDLDHDLRGEQLGAHHEVQALEGLIAS